MKNNSHAILTQHSEAKNMLKSISNIFERREYMSWKEYYEKIRFMENFYWQQEVRQKSAINVA